MSHSTARPVVGVTAAGTGATYIPLNRHASRTNIHVVANGTVTFTVDSTLDTILWDATALQAVNLTGLSADHVAPANALWVNEIASGSVSADAQLNSPVGAVRIDITAGTGTVGFRIQQA